jgi:hypothetical protein
MWSNNRKMKINGLTSFLALVVFMLLNYVTFILYDDVLNSRKMASKAQIPSLSPRENGQTRQTLEEKPLAEQDSTQAETAPNVPELKAPDVPAPPMFDRAKFIAHQKNAGPRRIAVFSGVGGYGNTMYGFLSGAIFCLLSNRSFFFQSKYNQFFAGFDGGWDPSNMDEAQRQALLGAKDYSFVDNCYTEGSQIPSQILADDDGDIFGEDAIRVTTNCPLFKFLGRNPAIRIRLAALGLFDERLADLPAGFQVAMPPTLTSNLR